MQMNQATGLCWMEKQEFATMQAPLYKILWGKLACFPVTLKKKGCHTQHSQQKCEASKGMFFFKLFGQLLCKANVFFKFSLSPKAKAQKLRQVKKARAEVGKNGCRALCGKCCKEENSLPVSGSTSGELVQVSVTQEHTRSCCWEHCDKLYGAPRDTPDFIKSEAIISTTIKVSWQAKTINVIKEGGGGDMLSVPIKEDSDCVVLVLHKILQVSRKGRNWAKRWVRSNTLYFCWKLWMCVRENTVGA